MEELMRLYQDYLQQAAQPQNQKRPFQGAYGFIGGPAPNSLHQQFAKEVEEALARVPEEQRREAVSFIFRQPLEHQGDPTVYWMFVAGNRGGPALLQGLAPEQAPGLPGGD